MNRIVVSCGLMVALFLTGANAQQASPSTAAACPPAATLDELIKSLDDAISGPRDKDRACLRELMLPEARLAPVRKQAESFAARILTVDDWINAVRGRSGPAFYEHQVKVKVDTYGHFAHLWSTYEIRPTPDGKAEVTGINSIQAVSDGKRWRILSILWESDATAGPIPSQYMP